MSTILHIDASIRAAHNPNPNHNSISKNIAHHFIQSWKAQHAIDEYIYRDVGSNPPPFITQQWMAAAFTPEQKRTAQQHDILKLSDQLIAEIVAADLIIIASPMYNYGMPAQLKAWFDQIARVNKTFDFDLARGDFPLQPTLSGKTLLIISSSGEFGFEAGGIREHMGHLLPHLRPVSQYLGVNKIYEIAAEYQEFADDRHQKSVAQAYVRAEQLASELSEKMNLAAAAQTV